MTELSVVGKSVPRVDSLEKTTGKAKFTTDLKLPGMLYAKMLRSPYPHARILHIDTCRAERLAGVRAVVTGKDLPATGGKDSPTERVGLVRDRWLIARDRVRFCGEPVAAVAADTVEEAEIAISLIDVKYEELPAVFDPEEAIKPKPPAVVHPDMATYATVHMPGWIKEPDLPNVLFHKRIKKGDIEKGFKEADVIVENRFSAARITHGALERCSTLVEARDDGGFNIWETAHAAQRHKGDLARIFGLPPAKVRIIAPYMGGSFGTGTTDSIVPTGIAALLSRKAGLPVRLALTREEVFRDGSNREPIIVYIRDGARKDGSLVAREVKLIVQAGAYSGLMPEVARGGSFGVVGTYNVPNLRVESFAVATNEPPATPFRGFGAAQLQWAIENNMDVLASKIGMDPLEIRLKNLLREGEEDGVGQTTQSYGARACLEKMADWIEWNKPAATSSFPWKTGKGIAVGNKNTVGGTTSAAIVKVHADGTIELRHSVHEVGQGGFTAMAQIAAEEFRTSLSNIRTVQLDTEYTLFDFGTVSSRATFHGGNAILLACRDAKRQLFELAAPRLGVQPDSLDMANGRIHVKRAVERGIAVGELFTPLGFLAKGGELIGHGVYTCPVTTDDIETGQGKRVLAYFGHGATATEVAVNVETGEVKVLRIASCFDMGQPINPKMCEQQIESGIAMGMNTALVEEIRVDGGRMLNPNFLDYKCPSSMDVPGLDRIATMMAPVIHQEGPFGAKGVGEAVMITPPPAIAQAIYEATGVRVMDTPVTKEKLLAALKTQRDRKR